MRLNRYLATTGHGSRRSVEQLIIDGRVLVNGEVVTELATQVGSDDKVTVDGMSTHTPAALTLALYKPKGVICSREPQQIGRPTVFDMLPPDMPRLYYVGRLDVDSEGLLIMTNQGELAEKLSHPRNKLPKVYEVGLDRPFEPGDATLLKKGILTEYGKGRAESVRVIGKTMVEVVLTQGLKRQIRLMFRALGYRVGLLRRMSIGGLDLGNLKPGHWRELNERDLRRLQNKNTTVRRGKERPGTDGTRPKKRR